VDDDPGVLRAIARLLRSHEFFVEPYESPWLFLDAIDPTVPGCVLLDLSLPEINGLQLQERLAALGSAQPVVFLTGYGSVRASVQAMQAGALDFIEKPFVDDVLLATVQRALDRDLELRGRRIAGEVIARRLASLTPREGEVFRHVIAGRLNKQIAARLGTAEKTVKVHRARVMRKMAVRSVAELTRAADFLGIQPQG
jgi:FixJ family two-component response regulator